MATVSEQVLLLATRIGTECYTLHSNLGTLANLSTTEQTSLVAALNEVYSAVSSNTTTISTLTSAVETLETTVASLDLSSIIDDETASTSTTYSSSKIEDYVASAVSDAKDDLLNGAGEAYDTLKELADLIVANQDAISALEALAAGHVKYDEAQELTSEQQAQARSNIDALGTTETAAAATVLETARTITVEVDGVSGSASFDGSADISISITSSGDDYVTAFETALAGTTTEDEVTE